MEVILASHQFTYSLIVPTFTTIQWTQNIWSVVDLQVVMPQIKCNHSVYAWNKPWENNNEYNFVHSSRWWYLSVISTPQVMGINDVDFDKTDKAHTVSHH
jgi:hypothetical protein